jgi:putative ATP-dependent endonuclease of the OLD family
MHIENIIIENFKCFEWKFQLALNSWLNIVVWNNNVWKSTILEAINLAFSWWFKNKPLKSELTEALFNKNVINNYLEYINNPNPTEIVDIPQISVEVYCDFWDDVINGEFCWDGNSYRNWDLIWFKFNIFVDEIGLSGYIEEVRENWELLYSLPIEFYDYRWESFSRQSKTPQSIPLKTFLIDSSNTRYQNGKDINTMSILRDRLEKEHQVKMAQVHRKLKDSFWQEDSIQEINQILLSDELSDKTVTLQIEPSTKDNWEGSLGTFVNNIPFQYIGRWEQTIIKTKLSLKHRKATESSILLIEEPENHLSHTNLNKLINSISGSEKQIIISTHSSFVVNKLWLESLILLNIEANTKRVKFKMSELSPSTQNYFKKLPWYDTLRLILCNKAILVEWDSDELLVQRAYMDNHNGKLPIEDWIEVISVRSLAFKRFLEISKLIKQETVVITDNDGKTEAEMNTKYNDFIWEENITISFDKVINPQWWIVDFNYNTLEPNLLKVNSLAALNAILWTAHTTDDELLWYMKNNKTDCALKIFDHKTPINYPQYILDVI